MEKIMKPSFAVDIAALTRPVVHTGPAMLASAAPMIGTRQRLPGQKGNMMWFNKKFLASMAVVGVSSAGFALQSTGAGAAVDAAHAKVTFSSKTHKFSGGMCPTITSHYFLVMGHGVGSGVTIMAKIHGGKFTNASITVVIGSKEIALTKDSGTVNAKGGTFKGTDIVSHSKVTGTFTC
jgi:hypothetical protein